MLLRLLCVLVVQHYEVQLLMQTLHLQAYIHVYNELWSGLAGQHADSVNDTSAQLYPQTSDRNPLQTEYHHRTGYQFLQ